MPEIDLESAIETNVLKLGTMTMEAHADRIIVVQDEFRTGYECTTCRARDIRMISQTRQASVVPCRECRATGSVPRFGPDQMVLLKCSNCDGNGWNVCPDCGGTGVAEGGLAHSQESERRPTTGRVVSIGPLVTAFKRGESVIYTSFSGHAYDLEAVDLEGNPVNITLVILRESEVLAKVSGHLELRRVKRSAASGTAA